MIRIRLFQTAALALALTVGAAPAFAQTETVQQTNPDADRLADEMRVLAADPHDMGALLNAAQYSARLGDSSAALAFLQRAETVDPTNPRILAGRASVLVRIERPGEALSLFQQAEARGLGPVNYASDRGFAYDLLGQPTLAQRDYNQAMRLGGGDDETVRRYALSLGIVGKPEEAMRVLDTLLRRSDRAAWRARAFILAMNGDVPGAERIAASMMPGSMGAGLSPFFRRLGGLSVADRAFAVHFGELSPTQARIADSRLAPQLAPYVPEPKPVVQVAAVSPIPAPVASAKDQRRNRRGRKDDLAAVTRAAEPQPAPVQVASNPLPPPPAFVPPPIVQPLVTPRPTPSPIPAPQGSQPVRFTARSAATPAPARVAAAESNYNIDEPIAPASRREVLPPVTRKPEPKRVEPKPVARVGEEDSELAAIVGGITIPANELEKVTGTPVDAPVPEPARVEPKPEPVRVAAAEPKPEPIKPVAKPVVKTPAKPDAKDAKPKVDPKTGKLIDPKTGKPLDAKAAAAAKAKMGPAKPDPKKADPSRVWVQVAGGANEDVLPATWKKLVAKAPALFKGKSGWTTPLRATNRLLAGPFKSDSEAQGFVNQLHKADMSGFVFTSEAGQKIAKLPAK